MKKYYLIYIFLCVIFTQSNSLVGQNNYQNIADTYFSKANYELAQLYYSRAAFDEDNSKLQTLLLFKKAEALLLLNKPKEAALVCQNISLTELNDSLRIEVLYKAAMYKFLSEDYFDASTKLNQLEEIFPNEKKNPKTKILNLLILNGDGKYLEAQKKLKAYIIEDSTKSEIEKLTCLKIADSIYNVKSIPKIKNVNKAMALNAVTLGFGYFYAGYYGEGISNFLFQTASLGLCALGIINAYYVSAIVAPLTIYNYFHSGSVKRIEYLLEKENYKKKYKFNTENKSKIITLLK